MTDEKRQGSGAASLTGELFSRFGIRMERYGEDKKLLLVSGAKAVLSYLPDFLELDMGQEFLIIRGSSLLARTFLSGNIEIVGRISEIAISECYLRPEEMKE